MNRNDDICFEILRHVCTVSERENGWAKELNKISWNNGEPKWDIREWSPDHRRMSRGMTLTDEEMSTLIRECVEEGLYYDDLDLEERSDESDN